MTGHIETLSVAAKLAGPAMDPRDRPASLGDHLRQRHVRQQCKVNCNEMRARGHERLGRKCALALAERSPGATVEKDMDRRVRLARAIDIDCLCWRSAIGHDLGFTKPHTNRIAIDT